MFAIDSLPSGIGKYLPLALEGLLLDTGDARGHIKAGGRVEDSDKALGHHLEELGLDVVQTGDGGPGGDDGVVVGYLGVVEDLAGLDHPVLYQSVLGMLS